VFEYQRNGRCTLSGHDFGEDPDMALLALVSARRKCKRSCQVSFNLGTAPKQLVRPSQGDVSQRKSIIRYNGFTECIIDFCIGAEQSVHADDIRIARCGRTRRQRISVPILQHWAIPSHRAGLREN
jgi:hypothetical protein